MPKLTITLKMFHGLQKYLPAGADAGKVAMLVDKGTTLEDLFTTLGIPTDTAKIVLINGQSQGVCTKAKKNPTLNEGDTVSIFPPVAGG